MTSTPLKTNEKKPFWINFSFKFKQNKKVFIMLIILQLISLPLLMIMTMRYLSHEDETAVINIGAYFALAILAMSISVLLGIIIATNTFNHLHKKSIVDMVYSLPLSIKDRFFSNFLSGLTTYIAPYVGAMILSLIIHAVGLEGNKRWNELFYGHTDQIIKLMIIGLFIMLFVYVLSVFITTCCGTLFESTAYIFIINALIPSSIAIFFFTMLYDLYGISIDKTVLNALKYTSPIGGLFYIGEFAEDASSSVSNTNGFFTWLGIYALVIAGIFVLTYFLYKRRKAEDVSKPFVYNLLYYIIISLITFDILAFVKEEKRLLMPLLIFSAIVYLIFEVVKNRGFKKIYMTALRYGVTVISVFILSSIVTATNFFGIEYYVPSENMIKSVTFNEMDLLLSDRGTYPRLTTDNPDVISALVRTHEDVIDYYKKNDNKNKYRDYQAYLLNNEQHFHVSFTYNMKTGTKSSRKYYLTFDQMLMLMDIYFDDNYINMEMENFENDLENNDLYIKSKFALQIKPYFIKGNINYRGLKGKLISAYEKDLREQTVEDILTPKGIYGYINSYPVRTTNKNTIAVLEEYGLTPYTMEEEFKSKLALSNMLVTLYLPDKDTKYTTTEYYAFNYEKTGIYFEINESNLNNRKLKELLKVAQPIYTTTDACYIIYIDGKNYVIPLEYSDLASEVYEMFK